MQAGKFHDAAVAFAAAISHDAARPEAWVNLAAANLHLNNLAAAENAAIKALNIREDYSPALRCMGDIYRMQGDLERAADNYAKACQSNPEPLTINNYATVLRTLGRAEQAESLYLEAERLAPNFCLPRVNRAIMQIELGHYEKAFDQLTALDSAPLNFQEREHQQSALLSLAERERLEPIIMQLVDSWDTAELEAALRATAPNHLEVDRHAIAPIEGWLRELEAAQSSLEPLPLAPLPNDWSEVEAAHMIPIVASAEEFRTWQSHPDSLPVTEFELHQSVRMIPAIEAADAASFTLADPVKAEAQLRLVHALCTTNITSEGFSPGRFKYTQTSSRNHPTARHVLPSKAAGTFRQSCELLATIPPGLGRAVAMWLTIVSLHPFSDCNGRVAMVIMNRELIACGLLPAIFSLELGPKGTWGDAEELAYQTGSILPMLEAAIAGQRHTRNFLDQLKALDNA